MCPGSRLVLFLLGRLILGNHGRRDTPPPRHSNTSGRRPLPDGRRVNPDRTPLLTSLAQGRRPSPDASPVFDELGERPTKRGGMPLVEIDEVTGAVKTKGNRLHGLAAVEIIDQRHRLLLRHFAPT